MALKLIKRLIKNEFHKLLFEKTQANHSPVVSDPTQLLHLKFYESTAGSDKFIFRASARA
jgi:hypothetical protein